MKLLGAQFSTRIDEASEAIRITYKGREKKKKN
jgi:hypothetical protein